MLNPNRVRHLAALGRRMGAQAIARMAPERRYTILVAAVVEGLVSTSDLVLDLFDTAVGAFDRSARRDLEALAKANADTANATVTMFGQVARVMLDPSVPDHLVRSTVFELIGRDRFTQTAQRAAGIERPSPGGRVDLVISQYRKARKFAPAVLAAFDFQASASSDPLLQAIGVLRDLYASGGRLV
ncbi:MAG: hypothetical protein GY773_20985, partial [Actinomycetia bacterium]|nr:hypothetical protein [Actinomycetes bacterium]